MVLGIVFEAVNSIEPRYRPFIAICIMAAARTAPGTAPTRGGAAAALPWSMAIAFASQSVMTLADAGAAARMAPSASMLLRVPSP
jgi:hypothetical protein